MEKSAVQKVKFQTGHYYILAPKPPFVDFLLHSVAISPAEATKIAELAAGYPNDPRLVEMVRLGGDASGKVPYLMDKDETPDSILAILRKIALPHIEHLSSLPEPVQATIHLLLSINSIPHGCEAYGIPALLEIDRIQGKMVRELRAMMEGRELSQEFNEHNLLALQMLDEEWPQMRTKINTPWPRDQHLPLHSRMQFEPIILHDRFVNLYETCVIVEPPQAAKLKALTPPILKRPLPEHVPAPITGSADWLIREVGKVGRHFTRALLDIIGKHLEAEQLALDVKNYEAINREAQEALRDFVENTP